MAEDQVYSRLAVMVRECEDYRDSLAVDRTRSIEYYDGQMTDTPADAGRSKVVSRDVRAAIKKVLPSVLRTILGNDEVVEYQPVGEGDEEQAQQASDYINYVVFPESDGSAAIHDAVHDALRVRNGVLKWWYDEKIEIRVSKHTGLHEDAFAELVNDPEVEVIGHDEREETIEDPETGQAIPVPVHDVQIKRKEKQRCAKVAAVPLDEFLIHPDAVSELDSPVVGQKTKLRRSDLVAMGYDADTVKGLPLAEEDEEEETARRPDAPDLDGSEIDPALQEVDYFELYVRTDKDGDGIAELRRMCFGGSVSEKGLLVDEECDDVQFCTIKAERKPHQWEGVSVSDDVMEIQRVKTVLLRQTLDNIYWQNNLQPFVQDGAIVNMEAVFNPTFGLPIKVKNGYSVKDAIGYNQVPFVAKDSFAMLEYLDNEMTDRTGISDASSGMAPDALQNMTAKASSMIESAGIGQTEQIVRTLAQDLKPLFRGLLRLIIRHQDAPRTVRLRDKWVSYDPRDWNASMDATVNTGLGAGTRERDMMMMQYILGIQEKLLAGFGPDNPFVKPENVYNASSKLIEAAGLRSPSLYITEPDPEEVKQKLEAARNQPNPEMEKVKAQVQLEQQKAQADAQIRQQQAEVDSQMKQAELEGKRALAELDMEAKAQQAQADSELKREQMAGEFALKREQLAAELQLKRELAYADLEVKRELGQATAAAKADSTSSGVHMGGEPG